MVSNGRITRDADADTKVEIKMSEGYEEEMLEAIHARYVVGGYGGEVGFETGIQFSRGFGFQVGFILK